jgi:myo-inositol-1(or 4)-monophosphatase
MAKVLERELYEIEDEELSVSVSAVVEAGDRIVERDLFQKVSQKDDEYVAHHAIVTEADLTSQNIILQKMHERFPNAYFIAEEGTSDETLSRRMLTGRNYIRNLSKHIFGVDSLDGTSQHQNGLYEWGVSIGAMQRGKHTSGAIYCPEVTGGLVVFGAKGKGAYFAKSAKGNNWKPEKGEVAKDKSDKDNLIYFGVDVLLDARFNRFVNEVSNSIRTASVNGSCALGLALVAIGGIDAFIQPHQRVWDWFGGYPLVVEAGGKLQFYRVREGKIMTVETPEPGDYNPDSRNLGFVAGRSRLVDSLMDQLIKYFGR